MNSEKNLGPKTVRLYHVLRVEPDELTDAIKVLLTT